MRRVVLLSVLLVSLATLATGFNLVPALSASQFTIRGLQLSQLEQEKSLRNGRLQIVASGVDEERKEKGTAPLLNRRKLLTSIGAATLGVLAPQVPAWAQSRDVGEIPASGLVFKDLIKITAFDDPKVKGVELYISDFQRPITERLQKNFFSDPTQASVGCAKTGPITVAEDVFKGKEGEEVFEQARSLLFKTLRVRRVYDEETNTIVYVSYSTRLNKDEDDNKSRFKTTTCAVHVD